MNVSLYMVYENHEDWWLIASFSFSFSFKEIRLSRRVVGVNEDPGAEKQQWKHKCKIKTKQQNEMKSKKKWQLCQLYRMSMKIIQNLFSGLRR